MSAEKPIQIEFKSRVDAAMAALEGYPGAPRTLAQLAADCGASQPNLASALRLRRTMTASMLKRLHRALKLDALGLPLGVWDQCADAPDQLARLVAERRGGDPIEVVRANAEPAPFLALESAGAFMGVRPGRRVEAEARPGLVVHAGQSLEISVRPPIAGFLKLICREGAAFFSLDSHLGLARRRMAAGEALRLETPLEVDAGYFGETVFIALAAAEPFAAEWPRGHAESETVSRESCADLLRAFFQRPTERRRACLFSVWTLPGEADLLS